uniref:Dual specificity protein phosphatase n=1 Tax=uncultured marine thaumarchaeote KM3_78_D03 TaxID=1456290 RepID=A0A075HMH1_9ARCH|nr:dual specificity protein phosphatase [uncultured marine thaumarchaeote KM3_78_D03]
MTKIGDAKRKLHGMITGKPDNFSWLIEGKLAGSAIPTSKDEIKWMQEEGVKSIVTIREEPLDEDWTAGMNYLHVLSDDMGVPSFDDLKSSVDYIDKKIQNKEPVMVHCLAGLGRTGTILACYLIKYEKMSAIDAIQHVREKRHGSIQSFVQEEMIFRYEKTLLD